METIIKCSNLTHYYGSRKIYEDLNFEVPKGRILGLLGKNGTGKTTTINILMGYLKPRMPHLRRRHTANAAGDPRAYRPAHREPCAIHVHEYRTDRAILLGFLSEMEQRSLL